MPTCHLRKDEAPACAAQMGLYGWGMCPQGIAPSASIGGLRTVIRLHNCGSDCPQPCPAAGTCLIVLFPSSYVRDTSPLNTVSPHPVTFIGQTVIPAQNILRKGQVRHAEPLPNDLLKSRFALFREGRYPPMGTCPFPYKTCCGGRTGTDLNCEVSMWLLRSVTCREHHYRCNPVMPHNKK